MKLTQWHSLLHISVLLLCVNATSPTHSGKSHVLRYLFRLAYQLSDPGGLTQEGRHLEKHPEAESSCWPALILRCGPWTA